MVRSFGRQNSIQKSKSFNPKKMFEGPGRQIQSLILESGHEGGSEDSKMLSKSYETRYLGSPLERHNIGSALSRHTAPVSPQGKQLSGKIVVSDTMLNHYFF